MEIFHLQTKKKIAILHKNSSSTVKCFNLCVFVLEMFKDHKFSHKYLSYYAISFKHIVKYLNNFPRNLLFNLHVSS